MALASYYKVEIPWKYKFEGREQQKPKQQKTKQNAPKSKPPQHNNLNLIAVV